MKNIYINADDFGLNSSVNKAIVESFQKKIINSTTLMANMQGFDEAIDFAIENNLIKNIGAHLVLTDGQSLTKEIQQIPFLFAGWTAFKRNRQKLIFLTSKNKKIIYNELASQIEKIQNKNIPITHLDSHHHVHEYYSITKILVKLAINYGIPSIRILNNLEGSRLNYKTMYRNFINNYLKRTNLNHSDFFGNQNDIQRKIEKYPDFLNSNIVEVMIHPDYDCNEKLIDKAGRIEYDFTLLKSINNK